MDEIYLVSKNKQHTTSEVITSLFTLVIKYKYLFSIVSYDDASPFPFCKIERANAHINDEGASVFPTIWVSFFGEKEIYMTDNNFPILFDGNNYYPIMCFQCRESLFLLELMIQIVSENADFLIRNVENRLMGVDELKNALESKNYSWKYVK